jgi:hypothetical protein
VKQMASIPEVCDSWSETCAAYQFLGNSEVSLGRIGNASGNVCKHIRSLCASRTRPNSISTATKRRGWSRRITRRSAECTCTRPVPLRHLANRSAFWMPECERARSAARQETDTFSHINAKSPICKDWAF